jgi:hypothetical protein
MLKIISSPPFDDYSKKLFFQMFGQKRKLGLADASFVYLWTGFLSSDEYITYKNNTLLDSHRLNNVFLPNFQDFITSHSKMLAGKKRFFNSSDDMYSLYCEYVGITVSRETFDQYYFKYAENVIDRSTMEDMIQDACTKDVVVLFVKDHFRISQTQSWIEPLPELSEYFSNLFDYYPNKKFILVTSLENLHKEIVKDNCTIIPMGGDITNQIESYMQFMPNVGKNADAKNFISLNRGPRNHRLYLVSSLYGRNLDEYGNVSYMPAMFKGPLSDFIQYDYLADNNYQIANIGYERYLQLREHKIEDSKDIYTVQNDNLTNFKQSLQSKYNNSIIEFVSETSYNERSFNITEKTLHFIYGANFPIMISSPGTVDFLRNMGIDMFDDLINHSYDSIADPAARINAAIDLNMDILTSSNMIEQWQKHKYRIDKNIAFVKEGKLRTYYSDRFWSTLLGKQQ